VLEFPTSHFQRLARYLSRSEFKLLKIFHIGEVITHRKDKETAVSTLKPDMEAIFSFVR
jgi:hypothetical protein